MLKASFDECRRGCAGSPMKPEIVGDVAECIAPGADRRTAPNRIGSRTGLVDARADDG